MYSSAAVKFNDLVNGADPMDTEDNRIILETYAAISKAMHE